MMVRFVGLYFLKRVAKSKLPMISDFLSGGKKHHLKGNRELYGSLNALLHSLS